jgi:hypothetical protein
MRTLTRRTFLSLLVAGLLFLTGLPSLQAAAPVERPGRITMLQQAKVLVNPMSGPMDFDLILDRLKSGPIAPTVDGRIQVAR